TYFAHLGIHRLSLGSPKRTDVSKRRLRLRIRESEPKRQCQHLEALYCLQPFDGIDLRRDLASAPRLLAGPFTTSAHKDVKKTESLTNSLKKYDGRHPRHKMLYPTELNSNRASAAIHAPQNSGLRSPPAEPRVKPHFRPGRIMTAN
ncbi:MAG: hypothetical protein L6R41_006440, partial [Letrouitia leprolyta]